MGPVRRGSPSTSPRTWPACLRATAATRARSSALAIKRASSEPAQPVAPATHTLSTMSFLSSRAKGLTPNGPEMSHPASQASIAPKPAPGWPDRSKIPDAKRRGDHRVVSGAAGIGGSGHLDLELVGHCTTQRVCDRRMLLRPRNDLAEPLGGCPLGRNDNTRP